MLFRIATKRRNSWCSVRLVTTYLYHLAHPRGVAVAVVAPDGKELAAYDRQPEPPTWMRERWDL
jgi:hypothetical protein